MNLTNKIKDIETSGVIVYETEHNGYDRNKAEIFIFNGDNANRIGSFKNDQTETFFRDVCFSPDASELLFLLTNGYSNVDFKICSYNLKTLENNIVTTFSDWLYGLGNTKNHILCTKDGEIFVGSDGKYTHKVNLKESSVYEQRREFKLKPKNKNISPGGKYKVITRNELVKIVSIDEKNDYLSVKNAITLGSGFNPIWLNPALVPEKMIYGKEIKRGFFEKMMTAIFGEV